MLTIHQEAQIPTEPDGGGIAWDAAIFVVVTHILGIAAPILYGIYHGFTLSAVLICVIGIILSNFAVGGGYHRGFTHGAYQSHWLLRLFFICFGSGTFEGSVFKWAALHRRHHIASDTEDDPHNISRGFFWAHMGWVLHKFTPTKIKPNIDDLKADPILRFQERYYIFLAIAFGVLLPVGIGWLCKDPWGALAIGVFLRIIVFHHITWFINSMAHSLGNKPYSEKITARDSFITAMLTLGEGYHNYHHAYPWDYRNGHDKLSWDPTKWGIWLLSLVRLTHNLQRVPEEVIARHDSVYR